MSIFRHISISNLCLPEIVSDRQKKKRGKNQRNKNRSVLHKTSKEKFIAHGSLTQ